MATAVELTDPYVHIFTRVPPIGPGICPICHRPPNADFRLCWSCEQTTSQVARPIERVIPISLYEVGGQLHRWLRGYKDDADSTLRTRLTLRIAATLGRFLAHHGECIAPAGWDVITTVPSTGARSGIHPLVRALSLIQPYGDQHQTLLERGSVTISHNRPSDNGFVTTGTVGQRVLLVDDTFTSGARLQSAASRLQLDGATVVGAVVIGRVLDRAYGERSERIWEIAGSEIFSFNTCCLEGRPWPIPGNTT